MRGGGGWCWIHWIYCRRWARNKTKERKLHIFTPSMGLNPHFAERYRDDFYIVYSIGGTLHCTFVDAQCWTIFKPMSCVISVGVCVGLIQSRVRPDDVLFRTPPPPIPHPPHPPLSPTPLPRCSIISYHHHYRTSYKKGGCSIDVVPFKKGDNCGAIIFTFFSEKIKNICGTPL